jgi:DNA mismatch repair protein MutS
MKNPLLLEDQITNPVSIEKNIIITGPNAGGKTTYVKSILSNIILAQTIGITYCSKSEITIYDCIYSFMRINDVLGSKSYFEAETEYCSKMIKIAKDLNDNNKKGLLIMDEPMHSTPPIEGMSTAYAVAKYIGDLQNIKLIITTHYHKLIDLEIDYPDKFINLSVNAEILPNNKFNFTYKIHKGYSKQCIALELLEKQKFPLDVIESAIKMKNKLCEEVYSSNK